MSDARRFLFVSLYAVWVFLFAYSFVAYSTAPYEGPGFPDGLNKPAVYLGWQGLAAMVGLGVFGVGLGWPKGSAARKLAALPLGLAVLHGLAVLGVYAWAGGS